MTYECAPSCGFTFDDVGEYLRHVAHCKKVLPGVAAHVARLQRLPVPATKKRKRTALEQKLPFPT